MVGFLLAVATVFAANLIFRTERGAAAAEMTQANMTRIRDAVVAYVALNQRLPCPALAADGRAAPETATTNCASPGGVVPWRTLGLTEESALDGWNRLISYRVLDGATGLTQADGASMVNCDTKVPYGADVLPANGLCVVPSDPKSDHRNLDSQYLKGKGLQINNQGSLVKGIAYVLISHGETGYGAYFPGGNRADMPASAHELANAAAGSPFYQDTHTAPGIDPGNAGHFDDILSWITITDLVSKSGLSARDWPGSTPPAITVNTLQNMDTTGAGHFNATTGSGGTFTATSTTSEGVSTATMAFGAGASSIYSSCAWWPTSFRLFNSVDRFTLSMYLEFAVADISRGTTDFGGFLVGFLPYRSSTGVDTVINNTLCGEDNFARNLGWAYDATVVPPNDPGNLPSPRFGIEYDAFPNSGANYLDPPYNHLAVDFDGTKHDDVLAADCLNAGDTYQYDGGNSASPQCYTSSSNAWLRSGLSKFHRMRLEVTPRDSTCTSPDSSRIKVWVFPESVCTDGTSDTTCLATKAVTQPFSPTLPLAAGVVALNRCIPASIPGSLFDQVYFGIMASNRSGSSPAIYLRNLDAAAYLAP